MIKADELQRAQAEISEEELEGVTGGMCGTTNHKPNLSVNDCPG
jgi:hypothetical protein